MLFFAVAVGIFLYVWNNKEDIDIYGTYVSEQNKLSIEISNKVISANFFIKIKIFNWMKLSIENLLFLFKIIK